MNGNRGLTADQNFETSERPAAAAAGAIEVGCHGNGAADIINFRPMAGRARRRNGASHRAGLP